MDQTANFGDKNWMEEKRPDENADIFGLNKEKKD